MKRASLAGSILLLFLIIATTLHANEPRLVKVGAFNYYPGIFKDTDGEIKGFYVDALADLAKRENLRIHYVYGSWSEGLERIKSGEVDLLTSVAYTPERAIFMDYSKTPLLTVWGELYSRKGSPIDRITAVQNKKIAVMKGDINAQRFVELVERFGITCSFIEVPGFEDVFRAIANKHVDAGVVNSTFGSPKHLEYGLHSTGVVFSPFDIYFTVAKGRNQELLALVDSYLRDWRKDPTSVYARARHTWLHPNDTSIYTAPEWLKNTIVVFGLTTLAAAGFIGLLRRQIRNKTSEILNRKQALLESEERYRSIFENSPSVMLVIEPESATIVDANPAAARYYGWSQEQLRQMLVSDINIMSLERIKEEIQQARQKNRYYFQFRHRLANGSVRDVEVFSGPIVIKNKTLLFSIVHDITERRTAEEALQESEHRYRTLVEHAPVAVLISKNDRIMLVNNVCLQLFGTSDSSQLIGRSPYELFHTDYHEKIRTRIEQLNTRPTHIPTSEGKIVRLDGTVRDVEITAASFQSARETAIHVVLHDITQRKNAERRQHQLEEQLRRSQRMEAIGTLAGGIAHDFNNILTAIIGYAHMSQLELPPDAPQAKHIQNIVEAANRATHLTRDLLLYSRKNPVSRKVFNLNETIAATMNFLQRIISENIQLKPRFCPIPVYINADSQQLDQVFMNLATNARDAMPNGGTLTISTDLQHLDENSAMGLGLPGEGQYALICFSDTGCGMSEDHLKKIFDPFFTTKEVGQGTGLGLPIAYGIIANHNGIIRADSMPDNGTTISIYLPCHEKPATAAGYPQAEEPLPRGTETILVVEDEERIRAMVTQALTQFGYQVLTAVDGKDALRVFNEHNDRIQLLLCDLVMPVMGGYEAYLQIQKTHPDIPVLFISGYAQQVNEGRLSQSLINRILSKPFTIPALLKAVKAALNKQENTL